MRLSGWMPARGASRRTTPAEVVHYYEDVTAEYEAYGGAAHSWNYGIWEPDVRAHQAALQRGKEWMVRGLGVGPTTRLLDVGCGSGGLAIWCASQLGCRVTGITISGEHVELATANALEAGVAERCEFVQMDMDALAFGDETFDVVTNQETFCYAQNKRRYLREVFRVLAPGGFWSSIDCNVRPGTLSRAEQAEVRRVLTGYHMPSLIPPSQTDAFLAAAGFPEHTSRDVTDLVLPTAALVMRRSREPLALARRFPRRRLHSPDAREEANIRGHYDAGMRYAVGLHTGLFQQTWSRARKGGAHQAASAAEKPGA